VAQVKPAGRPFDGAQDGAPGKVRPVEVVLVADGGTLTLEEAFPPHELARLMPRVRERMGRGPGVRDQGSAIST